MEIPLSVWIFLVSFDESLNQKTTIWLLYVEAQIPAVVFRIKEVCCSTSGLLWDYWLESVWSVGRALDYDKDLQLITDPASLWPVYWNFWSVWHHLTARLFGRKCGYLTLIVVNKAALMSKNTLFKEIFFPKTVKIKSVRFHLHSLKIGASEWFTSCLGTPGGGVTQSHT